MQKEQFLKHYFHDCEIVSADQFNHNFRFVFKQSGLNQENDQIVFLETAEDNVNFYYLKQYPVFHTPHVKGREITFKQLKKLLHKGKTLQIEDIYICQTDELIIKSEVLPYARSKGVSYNLILSFESCSSVYLKTRNAAD